MRARHAGPAMVSALLFASLPAPQLRVSAQASPQPYSALVFYIGAHQDDWELFRGNAAMKDLGDPNTRVVFIYASEIGRAHV